MSFKFFIFLSVLYVAVKGLPVANQNVATKNWRIHVTMHVFAGRSDPGWFVEDAHPQYEQILEWFKVGKNQWLPERLGYRGFKIIHLPPGKTVVSGNNVNATVTASPYWEMMLLNSAQLDPSGQLYNHAKEVILQDEARRKKRDAYDWLSDGRTKTSKSSNSGLPNWISSLYGGEKTKNDTNDNGLTFDRSPNQLSNAELKEELRAMNIILDDTNLEADSKKVFYGAPAYEPKRWNNWLHMDLNNCYNYANNEITDTMAQPGRANNCTFSTTRPTGYEIKKASICDGLNTVTASNPHSLPDHELNLVALVFWPPEILYGELVFDYHWYRLDNNGMFSHKPGQTAVTNVDNSGKSITDPRFADRGPYTEFVGFLETRRDKIKII